ncbi:hypothetical protein H4W00_002458 [Psychrobacter sp. PL19]|uniref:hypothetical protein n=1 Tax=Psychrobacter sp. PL19 TaxID=2760711 RepID=UPI001AE1F61B
MKYIDIDKEQNEEFNAAYKGCRNANTDSCKTFDYLHVTQRRDLNAKAGQNLINDLKSGNLNNNWNQLSDDKNIFHNFGPDGKPRKLPNGQYQYKKFVSKDGRLEVIVDSGKDGVLKPNEIKSSNIVTDPTNAGSYNYYAPNKLSHLTYDVSPYIDFGNVKGDKTSLIDRRKVPTPYNIETGTILGNLPNVNKNSNSILGQKYYEKIINDKINNATKAFEQAK